MTHSKRRNKFVDSQVQGALLRRIAWHWAMFFCVSGFAIIMLHVMLGDPNMAVLDRMKIQVRELLFLGVVMAALFPLLMLDTVRFSNRFVGPVSRFRRHLHQLSEGDTSTCAFRGSDFWSGMADEFNDVAGLVQRQQQEIERMEKLVEEQAKAGHENAHQKN